MRISFSNGDDKTYQRMLNNLLKDIFLDFQFWYDLGLWDKNYESYSIIKDGEIVSNICLYKSEIVFNQKRFTALSVGAVATKQEFRGRGLSRILMEHIIKKYQGIPMYLSANDGVVDFYPRFGFRRVFEKLPVCELDINNDIIPNRVKSDDPKVWDYVYNRINYSDRLDCLNTKSINMFHLRLGYLNDSIYEIPELKTLVIAEQVESTLELIGVFSLVDLSFGELVKFLPFKNVNKVEFGFMPYWSDIKYSMHNYDTDPIFVRNISCDLGEFKFPELSTT